MQHLGFDRGVAGDPGHKNELGTLTTVFSGVSDVFNRVAGFVLRQVSQKLNKGIVSKLRKVEGLDPAYLFVRSARSSSFIDGNVHSGHVEFVHNVSVFASKFELLKLADALVGNFSSRKVALRKAWLIYN